MSFSNCGRCLARGVLVVVWIFVGWAGAASTAQAQGTLQVQIINPTPIVENPNISALRSQYWNGRYQVIVTNTSPEPVTVLLQATFLKDGQTIATTISNEVTYRPGAATYSQFETGMPPVFFGATLNDLIRQLPSDLFTAAIRSGAVPEGVYTLRINPILIDGIASMVPGEATFVVTYPMPAEAVYPAGGMVVQEEFVSFQTTPAVNVPGSAALVNYTIRIVEMLDGQTPLDAIQANPTHAEISLPFTTSFPYTGDLLPLEQGRRYAWQVETSIISSFGTQLPLQDDGLSNIYTFQYQEEPVDEQPEPPAEEPPSEEPPTGEPQDTTTTEPPPAVASAPDLIAPVGDEVVDDEALSFRWTAPAQPSDVDGFTTLQQQVVMAPQSATQTAQQAVTSQTPVLDTTVAYTPGVEAQVSYSGTAPTGPHAWIVRLVGQESGGGTVTLSESDAAAFAVVEDADPPQVAACNVDAPTNTAVLADSVNLASDTLGVGAFAMQVTSASGAPGALSGTGTIEVPYLQVPLKVSFQNLRVNTDRNVLGGTVTAERSPNASPLPAGLDVNFSGDVSGFGQQEFDGVMTSISNGQRMAGLLAGQPTGLPLGLAPGGASPVTLAVVGASFTPTGARINTLLEVPLPGPNEKLRMGARGVCLTPDGLGNEAEIVLLEDLEIPIGTVTQRFNAPSSGRDGTLVKWSGDSIDRLRIDMEMEYPRTWLRPVDATGADAGGRAAARFAFDVTDDFTEWIAEGELDRSEITAAPGFDIQAATVVYDNSTVANVQGMTFPDGFAGLQDATWTGLYVPALDMRLPPTLHTLGNPDGRIETGVRGMLIDQSGVTLSASVRNLIDAGQGDLGGWAYSIDSLGVDLVSNSFRSAEMTGGVAIPAGDDVIPYGALLTNDGGSLAFVFSMQPVDAYRATLWQADLDLEETSSINVNVVNGDVNVSAALNGKLSIRDRFAGQSIDLRLVEFEGLEFLSAQPYVKPGTWAFASPQHTVGGAPPTASNQAATGAGSGAGAAEDDEAGGFPISIGGVTIPVESNAGYVRSGLQLNDVQLSLGENGGDNFSASTSMTFWGRIDLPSGGNPVQVGYDDTDLNEITLAGEVAGAFKANGTLQFFNDDPDYGNGIAGQVDATFIDAASGDATMRFGALGSTKYWYADLSVRLQQGIALGNSGLGLYGFNGGAYHSMRRERNGTESAYVVDAQAGLGLKAGTTLGTFPAPQAFNSDLTLEVSFTQAGGFRQASLIGEGYFAVESVTNRSGALAEGTLDLTWDQPSRTFDGRFSATFDVAGVVTGGGDGQLFANPSKAFLRVGTPSDPFSLNFIDLFRQDTYLHLGSDPPQPAPLPSGVQATAELPAFPSSKQGFVFGARASVGFDGQTGPFYGNLDAGLGYDMALLDLSGVRCSVNGRNISPGLNGWYAQGQVFAYVNGGIGIDTRTFGKVDIARVGASAVLQGGAPKPVWLRGTLNGRYNVLGGAVKGQFTYSLGLGDACSPPVQNPVRDLNVIADATPRGTSSASIFTAPTVGFNIAVDEVFTLTDSEGTQRSYRLDATDLVVRRGGASGARVAGTASIEEDGLAMVFTPDDPLEANTAYHASIRVQGKERNPSTRRWEPAVDANGDVIPAVDYSFQFTTGDAPDVIDESRVAHTYPLDRTRYFLQGETSTHAIVFNGSNVGYGHLSQPEDAPENTVRIFARYEPTSGGSAQTVPVDVSTTGAIEWTAPSLQPQTTYAVQLVRSETKPAMAGDMNLPQGMGNESSAVQRLRANNSNIGQRFDVKRDLVLDAAGSTVEYRDVQLVGERVTNPGERLLYVFHFRTSKHQTFREKLQAASVGTVDAVTVFFIPTGIFDVPLQLSEPLDHYAVYGKGNVDPLIDFSGPPVGSWFRSYVEPDVYDPIDALKRVRVGSSFYSIEFFDRPTARQRQSSVVLGQGTQGIGTPLSDADLAVGGTSAGTGSTSGTSSGGNYWMGPTQYVSSGASSLFQSTVQQSGVTQAVQASMNELTLRWKWTPIVSDDRSTLRREIARALRYSFALSPGLESTLRSAYRTPLQLPQQSSFTVRATYRPPVGTGSAAHSFRFSP